MKIFQLSAIAYLFALASLNIYNTYPNKSAQLGSAAIQQVSLTGAYKRTDGSITGIKIFSDNYFMIAYYDQAGKKFVKASGGTYTLSNGKITEFLEFSSSDSAKVGSSVAYTLQNLQDNQLYLSDPLTKTDETWIRIDAPDKSSVLAGDWRIREREQNGKMVAMPQGTRKTIKILSGSRFQWAAFNTETKQFSGTGGGTYKASDGKYTETVEFFSRDSSRIGMSLSFNYQIEGKDWHHTGFSTTGNKVNETWTKQ